MSVPEHINCDQLKIYDLTVISLLVDVLVLSVRRRIRVYLVGLYATVEVMTRNKFS